MTAKKKNINEVIDDVAGTAKKTIDTVSKNLTKENVKKTVDKVSKNLTSENVKKTIDNVSKTITKENVKKTVDSIKDTIEDAVDSGEKLAIDTTKSVKKKILRPELVIEFCGNQLTYDEIVKKTYEAVEKQVDMLKVKSLKIYYKVEDGKAYCVVNGGEKLITVEL